MNPEKQDTTHCFTCRKECFENEKTIQKTLRNPGDSEDSLQVVTIRPGLHVAAFRVDPAVMPRYDFDMENLPVGFAFHLSGKLESTLNRGRGKKTAPILNQRGVNSLFWLHGAKGHASIWPMRC